MNIENLKKFEENKNSGLTIHELMERLSEFPNQEQRVMMHIYKDGTFLKEEVTDVCQGQLEVVII